MRLTALLASAALPVAVGGSIVFVFVGVMMERMALAGHMSVVLADVVVGVLCGAGILAVTCGSMLPIVAYAVHGALGHVRWG